MGQKYVLAMYDIRGKQNFIFRKGKIQEVIGASAVIRDLFEDYLYPSANMLKYDKSGSLEEEIRKQHQGRLPASAVKDAFKDHAEAIYRYKKSSEESETGAGAETGEPGTDKETSSDKSGKEKESTGAGLSWPAFEEHLEQGYLGEVVYDGGGNFFVVYRDEPTCVSINRRFTRWIMEEIHTLKVLCSYVVIDPEENNFRQDRARLYQKNRENEANESVTIPHTVLPFTFVDPLTSMPFVGVMKPHGEYNEETEVSAESRAKLEKYKNEREKPSIKKKDELILDELVEEKGVSSLLAIIHIDGNNMGAMFQTALGNSEKYEDSITELRRLSGVVQDVHIDSRKEDIDNLLKELNQKEKEEEEKKKSGAGNSNSRGKRKARHRRAVVAAGDDFTIICKAQDALKVTEEYLGRLWDDERSDVRDENGKPRQWSACAGIAVFHSHAPFADAYRIAEECCDSAKKVMKAEHLINAELIDFEYLQSGIDMSLEKIRDFGAEQILSRPWIYRADGAAEERIGQSKKIYTWMEPSASAGETFRDLDLSALQKMFKGIARGNIKGLASAALDGPTGFRLELERMAAHSRRSADQGEGALLKGYLDYSNGGTDREKEKAFRGMVYDYVIFRDIWFADGSADEDASSDVSADDDNAKDWTEGANV